jgi:hypothetical protein
MEKLQNLVVEPANRKLRMRPIRVGGGRLIKELKWINTLPRENIPDLDRRGLFVDPDPQWLPPLERPDMSRFWGEYAELIIEHGRNQSHVHLLHIGIGGPASHFYFFQPHGIKVLKMIGTPY